MRYKIFIYLALLLFLSSFIYARNCSTNPNDYYIYDTFEDNDVSDWTENDGGTGGLFVTSTAYAYKGTYGAQYGTNKEISADRAVGFYKDLISVANFTIEFDIYPNDENRHKYIGIGNDNANGYFLQFRESNNQIRVMSVGAAFHVCDDIYQANNWYNVTLRINVSSQRMAVYINDTFQPSCSNLAPYGSPTPNKYFFSGASGAGNNASFDIDNILIYTGEECPIEQAVQGSVKPAISTLTELPLTNNTIYGYCQGTHGANVDISYDYKIFTDGDLRYDTICYQEMFNISEECTGTTSGKGIQYSGWTNADNIYDGNYSTFGSGNAASLYINYSKPEGKYLRGALWQVKDAEGIENLTIPNACIDSFAKNISFRVRVDGGGGGFTTWYCWNTSAGWSQLRQKTDTKPYEEALFWQINTGNYTKNTNVTVFNTSSILGDYITSCRSYANGSWSDWKNSSSVKIRNHYLHSQTFTDYVNVSNNNHTRNLNYNLNISCTSGSNYLYLNTENNTQSQALTCNGTLQTYSGIYTHNIEGFYWLNITVNHSLYGNDHPYNKTAWYSDLNDPTITILNITTWNGFAGNQLINISLQCTDNVSPILFYNLTYNNTLFNASNVTAGITWNYTTIGANGAQNLTGYCYDFFGNDSKVYSPYLYMKNIILIDEQTNSLFDVNNLTSVKVFLDNNQTLYDFKTAGTSKVVFSSLDNNKLRFEFKGYIDGQTIIRYVDASLFANNISICVNTAEVEHIQQLLIASSERRTILRNLYSDCVITADYTRFAYQDALLLKAWTIDTYYYLNTWDNGQMITLASVDGGISAYINIDQLEFRQDSNTFTLLQDTLAFEKSGDTEIKIYYRDSNEDNTDVSVNIQRTDTNTLVYSEDNFPNMNEFTIYFDYSTLFNVTNRTVFKIDIVTSDGDTENTLTRYFNTQAVTGILSSPFALAMAIFLTLFGFTFTISRLALSWLGIMFLIISIGILSTAIMTWYILLLIVIDVILIIYLALIMWLQTYPTVA